MGVLYPGPVSRHNLVCPLLRFWYRVPMWDSLCFGHDGGRCVFGRHRATQYYPKGSESEWPGECHGSRSVLLERRWSTRMGVRGHGFRGVGKVCYLCSVCVRVLNLSIAASSIMGMGSY